MQQISDPSEIQLNQIMFKQQKQNNVAKKNNSPTENGFITAKTKLLKDNQLTTNQKNQICTEDDNQTFSKRANRPKFNPPYKKPILNPDLFKGLRSPPKGLLLFGPPGTGKTMIGKAIASECKATFFNISSSSLTSKWVGEGEKLVRTLFTLAEHYKPSVIFIDEIDSLLCARQENENEASRRIKTEFMVRIEGAGNNDDEQGKVLLVGATNRPQELDDAVRRRFTKRLYIPLPNKDGRKQQFLKIIDSERERQNSYDINDKDIDKIVELTKGYSCADIRILCAEAAMQPLRQITDITLIKNANELRPILFEDFQLAMTQVKSSISSEDLEGYWLWNKQFGSFNFDKIQLDN